MFKNRFKYWGLSKRLRADEVLALLRVKAARDADGAPVAFSRHGRPITMKNLKRYKRDSPKAQVLTESHAVAKASVDDLIQNFLPSRGLVALVPRPSKGLRGDEALYVTESSIASLRSFENATVQWRLERNPESPRMLYAALFNRDVAAPEEPYGNIPWSLVDSACNIMRRDVMQTPDEFIIEFIWVMSQGSVLSELVDLAHHLMRHASQLLQLTLGQEHPYSVLAAGATKLARDSLSFKHFQLCLSEVFVDAITKRTQSIGQGGTLCPEELHKASPQQLKLFESALGVSEMDRLAVLLTLVSLRERSDTVTEVLALHQNCQDLINSVGDHNTMTEAAEKDKATFTAGSNFHVPGSRHSLVQYATTPSLTKTVCITSRPPISKRG